MKPRQQFLLTVYHTKSGPNVRKSEETWSATRPFQNPCLNPLMSQQAPARNLKSFDDYIEGLGRTRRTGLRWRKAGLINAVNIYGRLYIAQSEIERFEKRAINGEFAKKNARAK